MKVRNLGRKTRRIRYTPPTTGKFLAEYETLGLIAGGISTTITISFETDKLGDFHDEIQILSDKFVHRLFLHAY